MTDDLQRGADALRASKIKRRVIRGAPFSGPSHELPKAELEGLESSLAAMTRRHLEKRRAAREARLAANVAEQLLDLKGLIKKHGRKAVAEAAGIDTSYLSNLANPRPKKRRARVHEGHLKAWLAFDPLFDPTLEIERRRDAEVWL